MSDKTEVHVVLNREPSLMSYICCCANTRDESATTIIRRAEATVTPTVTEIHEEVTSPPSHEQTPLLIPRSPVTTHGPIIVRGMLSEMLRIPSDEVYL